MTKIIVTGGSGRFGKVLQRYKTKHKIFYPEKKDLDILDTKKLKKYLLKKKPKILIHLAGLSRPLDVHEKQIERSIDLNIIGTANVTDEANFIDDLGADSLDTVELVMAFEEEFGSEISDSEAEKILTVGDAVKFIEGKAN